jgi:hypothetical protein
MMPANVFAAGCCSADCIGSDRLPLTQEYLADMLGVRRTTVTLLAQELQERGAIRYTRGKITIVDRKALERCACECYEATNDENLLLKTGVTLKNNSTLVALPE